MRRVLMVTAACGVMWAGSAEAQTCVGNMSFESAPMRAGGEVSFSSDSFGLGGGIAKQFNNNLFGGGGLVLHGISGGDGTGKGFYVSGGTERNLGANEKFFLCPLVNIVKLFGIGLGGDNKLSSLLVNFGGMVGFEASQSGTTRIVPTFGLTINIMRNTFSGGFFDDFTDSTTFAALQAGVGLIFNDKMSLVPMLSLPFNQDAAQTLFTVVFSMKIGQ
jgi:hypothetical protein